MEAEREIASYYAALFMKDKVGEQYDGVVAAVVEFGMFVELRQCFVEGLVRVEDLGEATELDPVLHALVDRTTGRAFRVGDELRVEVLSASPERRRIELGLVEEGRTRRAAGETGEARRPGAGERQRPPRAAWVAAGGRPQVAAKRGSAEAPQRARAGHGHDEGGRGRRGAGSRSRPAKAGKGGKPAKAPRGGGRGGSGGGGGRKGGRRR
jgi:ribonuclease R